MKEEMLQAIRFWILAFFTALNINIAVEEKNKVFRFLNIAAAVVGIVTMIVIAMKYRIVGA